MEYLLKVQKAIAQTNNIPVQSHQYIEGWVEAGEDLTYAISLSETATRQHIDFWTNSLVTILDDDDQGYCDRIDQIYELIEEEGK